MREVVFDVETTGTRTDLGHRVVEIGAVEIVDGAIGDTIQFYFNPHRPVEAGAYEVHGLSDEFLSKQSDFSNKLADILAFFGSDPLIAHNAGFDRKFINNELKLCDYLPFAAGRFIDTLKMSRQMFKSGRHSLDHLCARFDIDISDRVLHGALKDSILLAKVYIEMTKGTQHAMQLDALSVPQQQQKEMKSQQSVLPRGNFKGRAVASVVTSAVIEARHEEFLRAELKKPLWLQ